PGTSRPAWPARSAPATGSRKHRRAPRHAEHGLAHPLVLVQLPAGHGEVEDGLVAGDRGLEVLAGDPHAAHLVHHPPPPPCPARCGVSTGAPPKMSSGWPLGIVADVPPAPHRGGGAAEEPCQKR